MKNAWSAENRRSSLALCGALLLAFLLGIYYVLPRLTSNAFGHDEGFYMAMAQRLVEEHVYSYGPSGEANAFVPPGLPLYLSLCYLLFGFGAKGLAIMRILQILYTVLTVYLAYVFCQGSFGKWAGVLAAWMIASNLSFYSYTTAFLTENLYFLFMMLFAVLFSHTQREDRPWLFFASGALFCACVMIRSAIVAILPVMLIPVLQRHKKESKQAWLRIGLFLGGFVLLALPWWIRNALLFHEWIPFCKQDHIVFMGLAQDLSGYTLPKGIGGHLRLLGELFERDGIRELRWLTLDKFWLLFLDHGSDLNSRLYTLNTAIIVALGLPLTIHGLFVKERRIGSISFLLYLLVIFCGVPTQRYGLQFLFYLSTQAALLLTWILSKIKRNTRVHL